jgi:type IV pilus assembly protein PilY1
LLHAFWADETTLENNEMWAMAPPAVLPNVAGNPLSSHNLFLDGAPVVKDVVWDRNATTTASNAWHTMLVAGYGSQGQGYYAVDVTNPDATSLGNGIVPADPPPPGPVFRWQLTKLPSPSTYQLFGQSSATPAITTLFMDPGDGGGAREIGVAILPGGKDGPPTTSTACLRLPLAGKTTAPLAPAAYPTRASVRCWGAGGVNTARVNGRSLSIVRIDTGEIIRVFVRAADVPNTDLLATASPSRIIDTQLDSPMTGTPVVFPADIGADASKIFVGDEDGTLWRFDVSSSNPSNWKGSLFLDFYNATVDTTGNQWGDGQPFAVAPTLSLDPAGRLVIDAATGSTDQYDATALGLVYSITETGAGTNAGQAFSTSTNLPGVNWWLGPPGTKGNPLFPVLGERVSGPMTVFNGTLFFSTYSAGQANTTACNAGLGRIWGLDFETAASADLSQGGVAELPNGSGGLTRNVTETSLDSTLAGAVIPGVSIRATPACANLGTGAADQYVPGATHASPQSFTSGSFSLFTQVGKSTVNGASGPTPQLQIALPTPIAPTIIDSWAAVVQ